MNERSRYDRALISLVVSEKVSAVRYTIVYAALKWHGGDISVAVTAATAAYIVFHCNWFLYARLMPKRASGLITLSTVTDNRELFRAITREPASFVCV